MHVTIKQSSLHGDVFAPPSKSYTHRAITFAALSRSSKIHRPLLSADTLATVRACEMFGAVIEQQGETLYIQGVEGKPKIPDDVIDVANSGTTLRFMTAISALTDGITVLTGDSSLRTRPNGPLLEVLRKLNVKACSTRDNSRAPLVVKGGLEGAIVKIDGSISSQFISALLIACPLAKTSTTLSIVGEMKSRPYVDMTLEILELAGGKIHVDENNNLKFIIPSKQKYRLGEYTVPGDFSSASYILAAAALTDSVLTVRNLYPSKQGDMEIIEILERMGADLTWDKEAGVVTVRGGKPLKGITFDAGATPDLVPTIAVLASLAEGTTRIENAEHVRYKETDRLHALAIELPKLGVKVKEENDGLIITGGSLQGGVEVNGWHDHRIVMALTVAGLVAGDITIDSAESVSVSYPDFFKDMDTLGAQIEKTSEKT
ncbi:MAG: 3-phosphoshikimate 1-carboxyvinyltransferase [Methanosarcinaceae archaeon]|nr:3-phosphoshikimate 1-carboxyvinyltransferase [Methanosarcinaceae archaeon]